MRFVGRQQEGRALLLSVRAGRGVVLSTPPGYGKSTLLEEVRPALEAARLERRKGREAERQLVRSPVAGQVAEVKVRDVGPKGVTVEVVIVRRD